jgi:hypothetical protein
MSWMSRLTSLRVLTLAKEGQQRHSSGGISRLALGGKSEARKCNLWRNVRDRLTWHDGASARSQGKRWSTRLGLERLEDRMLLTVTDMTQLAQLYPTHSGPTLLLRNFDVGYNDDRKDVIVPWACTDWKRQPSCPRPSGNRGSSSGTASRTR